MHGKELSSEQRERIIGAYLNNVKQNVIASQLNISTSMVNNTKRKQTNSAIPKKRPGRPKTLTDQDRNVAKFTAPHKCSYRG